MPNDLALIEYKALLSKMNRSTNRRGQLAPHKPILMLAILGLIEDHTITSPIVELSSDLIERFNKLWGELVPSGSYYKPRIELPFYHMKTERFWHLVPMEEWLDNMVAEDEAGERTKPIPELRPTVSKLRKTFVHAYIDRSLFLLMQDQETRTALRVHLISLLSTPADKPLHIDDAKHLNVKANNVFVGGDCIMKGGKKIVKKNVA